MPVTPTLREQLGDITGAKHPSDIHILFDTTTISLV